MIAHLFRCLGEPTGQPRQIFGKLFVTVLHVAGDLGVDAPEGLQADEFGSGGEHRTDGEEGDVLLTNEHGHKTVLDVVVVGPKMKFKDEWCAQGDTDNAGMSKRVVYAKWDIAEEDVVPLAFSTYWCMWHL